MSTAHDPSTTRQVGTERDSGARIEPDWATQVVDALESFVTTVRTRTTEPVLRAVRTVLFGLLAAGLIVAALLLATIGGVRFVDSYLPGDVWSAHLLVGGIFVLAGWLCFRRSMRPPTA